MAAGGTARRSPTCSAIMVPWLKSRPAPAPTAAIAGARVRRRGNALSTGAAALTPTQRSPGSRNVSGNHSRPHRRLAARARRVRRHEGGVRQQALPRRGRSRSGRCRRRRSRAGTRRAACALPERGSIRGRQVRAVEFSHFCRFLFFAFGFFAAAAEPAPRRASSPRDSRPRADAPPRRARAARPRAIFASALASGRLRKPKRDARGFLHGEIAGRKGVGMAEAEQQIDVGGPRADAVQRGERGVRLVGLHVADARRDRCGPWRRPCRSRGST